MGTIRTLLAISVLITHSELIFGRQLLAGDPAVTCFYILSGFLITLILSEKYTDTKIFYINRALRIYVPYLSALAFSIIVFWIIENPYHDPEATYRGAWDQGGVLWIVWSTISNLTLVGMDLTRYIALDPSDFSITFPSFLHPGLSGGHGLLFVPQAWTLGVELQFYLLAPLLVKLRLRWLVVLAFALLVARTVLFARVRSQGVGLDDAAIFPMQLVYFLLGALGYHGYRGLRRWQVSLKLKRRLSATLTIGAVLIIVFGLDLLQGRERPAYDFYYLAFAFTVPFQFFLTRDWRFDKLVGEYSYPIYVFHFGVNALFYSYGDANWRGEVVLLTTIAVSALYIHTIDRPVQRLRARLARRQTEVEARSLSLTAPVVP